MDYWVLTKSTLTQVLLALNTSFQGGSHNILPSSILISASLFVLEFQPQFFFLFCFVPEIRFALLFFFTDSLLGTGFYS